MVCKRRSLSHATLTVMEVAGVAGRPYSSVVVEEVANHRCRLVVEGTGELPYSQK